MSRTSLHRTTSILVALVLAACGGATATSPSASTTLPAEPSIVVTADLGSPHVGDAAPDFELVDQSGATVSLASLRGSVVALALVSSWCPYSTSSQPHLASLARDYAPKGAKTLAVVVADSAEGYRKYLAHTDMPFPVMHDANDAVALAYAPVKAQPSFKDRRKVVVTAHLVLDPEGKIRFYTILDTAHFDSKLVHVRKALDDVLSEPAS